MIKNNFSSMFFFNVLCCVSDKKDEKGEPVEHKPWGLLEALQLVLQAQVEALIRAGFPAELTVCYSLFFSLSFGETENLLLFLSFFPHSLSPSLSFSFFLLTMVWVKYAPSLSFVSVQPARTISIFDSYFSLFSCLQHTVGQLWFLYVKSLKLAFTGDPKAEDERLNRFRSESRNAWHHQMKCARRRRKQAQQAVPSSSEDEDRHEEPAKKRRRRGSAKKTTSAPRRSLRSRTRNKPGEKSWSFSADESESFSDRAEEDRQPCAEGGPSSDQGVSQREKDKLSGHGGERDGNQVAEHSDAESSSEAQSAKPEPEDQLAKSGPGDRRVHFDALSPSDSGNATDYYDQYNDSHVDTDQMHYTTASSDEIDAEFDQRVGGGHPGIFPGQAWLGSMTMDWSRPHLIHLVGLCFLGLICHRQPVFYSDMCKYVLAVMFYPGQNRMAAQIMQKFSILHRVISKNQAGFRGDEAV